MFDISTNFPISLSIFILLIGIGYAYFLYNKEEKIDSIWIKRTLFLFRFLVVSFLCFLLLNPLIKSFLKQKEKPILIIAQDASSSVKNYSVYDDLSLLSEQVKEDFDVFPFHFNQSIKNGLTKELNGSQSNYSNLFDELEIRFINRNVAAIVMTSDGLYNVGENPIYKSNAKNIPIFPIAIGDTIQRKDLLIKDVQYNEIAFLGNDFPIAIYLDGFNYKNEVVELKLYDGKSLLHKQKIKINKDEFHLKVPLKIFAKHKGLKKYSIQLSSLETEINKANNNFEIFVDVLDSKHNVLLLFDNPHPDIAAFRSVLTKNKQYSIEVKKLEDFNQNIERFNLIVLFGIPSNSYSGKLTEIINSNVPLLFFINASTTLNYFTNLYKGLSIKGKNSLQEVLIAENDNFSLFTISSSLSQFLTEVPPLHVHFGDYRLTSIAEILLSQQIGKIKTEKPILFFENSSNRKIGVFTGEGFWKWKLMEYAEQKNNRSFDELFSKTTKYLLLQDDKSHFRLKYEYKINANAPIIFEAEFYNDSYEPTIKSDISLTIKDDNKNEYPFIFSKLNNSYHLNVGSFPVGEYSFIAKVNGETHSKNGSFSVIPFQMEFMQTQANHQLLYNLAYQSGGKMFFTNQIEELIKEITHSSNNKTIVRTKEKVQEMINIQWILFTLLLLICIEWFVRKYNGLQ